MDNRRVRPSKEQQKALFAEAQEAAAAYDPRRMLECLHSAYALEVLTRDVNRVWSRLSLDDANDVASEAVNILYEKVISGEKVSDPMAYMTKVCRNKAKSIDLYRSREEPLPPDEIERLSDSRDSAHSAGTGARHDERRKEALRIARSLLPQLGQQNLREVMKLTFEAVEKGVPDLPAREVAEILGLSEETVWQSRKRGFERLERLARKEGLIAGRSLLEEMDVEPEAELI